MPLIDTLQRRKWIMTQRLTAMTLDKSRAGVQPLHMASSADLIIWAVAAPSPSPPPWGLLAIVAAVIVLLGLLASRWLNRVTRSRQQTDGRRSFPPVRRARASQGTNPMSGD